MTQWPESPYCCDGRNKAWPGQTAQTPCFITAMCHPPSCRVPPSFFGRSSQRLFVSHRINLSFSPLSSPLSSSHRRSSLRSASIPCAASAVLHSTRTPILDRHPRAPLQRKARPFHLDVGHGHWLLLSPTLTSPPCQPLFIRGLGHRHLCTPSPGTGQTPHLLTFYDHKTSPSPNVELDRRPPNRR